MNQLPKILKVSPLPNRRLQVEFDNGRTKNYDCNILLQRPEFFLLKDDVFFKSVKVDAGGYGISWNDDVDISEYELWTNGVELHSEAHILA